MDNQNGLQEWINIEQVLKGKEKVNINQKNLLIIKCLKKIQLI